MSPPPTEPGYSLVWSDNFAGPAGSLPNQSKWNIISKGPNAANQEVQHYTQSTSNSSVNGSGVLHITPQHNNGQWTSARLEGKNAFNCPDGHRMLLQAELRTGTSPANQQAGIWPAFWALGNDIRNGKNIDWPQCGEWDIMENAHGADFSLATLHYGRGGSDHLSRGGPGARVTFQVESFHTWAIKVNRTPSNWQDETLEWWLDGNKFFQIKGSDIGDGELWGRVAHKSFFPILNVAVGSNFPGGGQPDNKTVTGLGSGLQVKYIAFYQSN
ncbi:glycoside hydrolase family 16 protein [Durotheca rogersii]|uniref:glycoside hydrolase family 16 protein n=1 Tax=Durotheca rogersii TaxID=419775 RepID=UPI00221EA5C0|nr:glycoside hydrolase family 16 protein [Durotheca rogersii]KAI5855114.1 glycoside hydrolase family 16 protein [Durotheca rogersii]